MDGCDDVVIDFGSSCEGILVGSRSVRKKGVDGDRAFRSLSRDRAGQTRMGKTRIGIPSAERNPQ